MTQKYDPSRKYSWTPQDTFTLTGEQFATVLNAIRGIMSSPEAMRIIAISKANDVIESMMIAAVEEQIVLEMPEADKKGMTGLTIKK